MQFLTVVLLIHLAASSAPAGSPVVWDIGQARLFDPTHKAYSIEGGRVVVDLASPAAKCPTGLGQIASGREAIKTLELRFKVEKAGDYWLHVLWEPGGSGQEQIAVASGGREIGKTPVVDAAKAPNLERHDQFQLTLPAGAAGVSLQHLSGDGLQLRQITLTADKDLPHVAALKPTMKFPTREAFAAAIGEPAVLLDGPNVRLLAPQRRGETAKVVFAYLEKAYDELYAITGIHTKYKIVAYALPEGHKDITGGTGECEILYGDANLDPATFESRGGKPVPHVSGFIEEMAHNFVSAARVQFGWEMVGWSVGMQVSRKVAPTSDLLRNLADTRRQQTATFQAYVRGGYVFPKDVKANLCDRIHAYLLWQCEQKYGQTFWRDFFAQVREAQPAYLAASRVEGDDARRNARYRVTVDCFDRLKGLEFKKLLARNHISLTTDVRSLHPESEGWNRKFEWAPAGGGGCRVARIFE